MNEFSGNGRGSKRLHAAFYDEVATKSDPQLPKANQGSKKTMTRSCTIRKLMSTGMRLLSTDAHVPDC